MLSPLLSQQGDKIARHCAHERGYRFSIFSLEGGHSGSMGLRWVAFPCFLSWGLCEQEEWSGCFPSYLSEAARSASTKGSSIALFRKKVETGLGMSIDISRCPVSLWAT